MSRKKKKLSEYEQRLHNNWMRRQKQRLRQQEQQLRPSPDSEPTVAYSKENLQLHWQDQAALDEQHRRELALRAQKRRLRKIQQRRKQDIEGWIKENNNQVDTQKLATLWETTARQHRDQLLELAIRAFAIVDAATQANRALKYGLNMETAELDLKEVSTLVTRFLRVEMGVALVKNLKLGNRLKQEILDRLVAREFPTRDNKPSPTKSETVDTTSVLRQALKREVQKFETN